MKRRRTLIVAGVLLLVGSAIVIAAMLLGDHTPSEASSDRHSMMFVTLLPIYTSLMAVFVATRRRRHRCGKENSNG